MLLAGFSALFLHVAQAQTYTAKSVVFSDRGDFTQQQLEDATGLHGGTSFQAAELGAAAQKLVDTGYFGDVSATLDGKLTACTVRFAVKPLPRNEMLHVGFENFVWLTHDEIAAAIHQKFPLFDDYLPENSPHQDEIKATLTAALAARRVTATVAFDTYEPTVEHPLREVGFSVSKPAIRVANIKLAGVTSALAPLLQRSLNRTLKTAYSEGPADETTAERILRPLLDAGYVQAKLTDVALSPTPAADGSIALVLSAKLASGDLYHVAQIDFTPTPIVSLDAFNAQAKLHKGDVAALAQLEETLLPVDAAYRRQGYMDVVVQAAPTFDDAAHTVSYAVSVTPGEVYHVKDVTANGLDPAAQKAFDRGFLMKAGERYNPEYAANFLKANTALQELAGYSATFKAYASPDTRTVELIIFFRAPVR